MDEVRSKDYMIGIKEDSRNDIQKKLKRISRHEKLLRILNDIIIDI